MSNPYNALSGLSGGVFGQYVGTSNATSQQQLIAAYQAWQAQQVSHDTTTEAYLDTLRREQKWVEWVRESRARKGVPVGFFKPVPACACAWCALSELERQVAIAKASEQL